MLVILIAIGMHTKPCIAFLAFTTCNWKSLCNTDLILQQKKAFSAQNMMVLRTYMKLISINALLCPVFANRVTFKVLNIHFMVVNYLS